MAKIISSIFVGVHGYHPSLSILLQANNLVQISNQMPLVLKLKTPAHAEPF